MELHSHDFHEFFWVEKGSAIHRINGQAVPLQAGDLILLHSTDAHTFEVPDEQGSLRIVNFAFLPQIWTYMRQRYFNGAPVFFSAPSLEARSYTLDKHQMTAIGDAARFLRRGLRDRLQTESFLLNVLALLKAGQFNSQLKSAPTWLRDASIAISTDRNFAGGMPALARLAGRSPEHIAREFRRYLDCTPTDFINNARMSYAAGRLATSEDQIIDIALDCGLENLGHFYRLFHSRYDCTPRAYRLQQRTGVSRS